ncbi:hypothetical protein KFK09_003006 [Dendrobium nobile]|uniref:Uncharacterized protein n=1 Tax=Dendrobium nobile TaxID=94219 RepID=A0A8T3C8U4_DENNO|nr:hypothetical protein KFK09_003006 [Dendrobium nobile]
MAFLLLLKIIFSIKIKFFTKKLFSRRRSKKVTPNEARKSLLRASPTERQTTVWRHSFAPAERQKNGNCSPTPFFSVNRKNAGKEKGRYLGAEAKKWRWIGAVPRHFCFLRYFGVKNRVLGWR